MMKKEILIVLIALIAGICRGQEVASANVLVKDFKDVPVQGAEIQFLNTKKGIVFEGVSNTDGTFVVDLPPGEYNIRLKSRGKTKDYSVIEIPTLGEREVYNDVNIVIQYAEETSFTLDDLHFQSAKAVIEPESCNELNELVRYLELKPSIKIEIAGHTDSEGTAESNLDLSQRRSEAVKNWLVQKGINKSRIVAKGYGEEKPIAENETEAGKALNRRTEINVLE